MAGEIREGVDETYMDVDCSFGVGGDAGGNSAAGKLEQREQHECTGVYLGREPEVSGSIPGVGVPDVGRGYELQPQRHGHGSFDV